MKARDTERAAMLVRARRDLGGVERDLRRTKPRGDYDYRGVEIGSGDYCDSGSESHYYLTVDLVTGRRIAKAVRSIIADELRKLGVRA